MALFALSQAAFYYAFKYIIASMDPLKTKKKDAHEKSAKVLDRLGVNINFFCCSEIFFVILSNNPPFTPSGVLSMEGFILSVAFV